MKFDPQKYHRRTIRLKEYDYTQPGGYFVTIVAYQRDCLFGEIMNEEMQLNEFGCIADECWRAIPDHFHDVELGAYVIMPNHMHGIIVICADENGMATNSSPYVGASGAAKQAPCLAPTTTRCETPFDWCNRWIIQIGGYQTHRARIERHWHLATQLWSLS